MDEQKTPSGDEEQKSLIPEDFDGYVRLLIQLGFEMHDKKYGMNRQKIWMVWISQFYSLYIKGKNPDLFKEMFIRFYNKHQDVISTSIFEEKDDETEVNDEWLKDKKYLEGPGFKARQGPRKKKGWSPSDNRCRGKVIYFDDDNPKRIVYSIPISEIYMTATQLYEERGEEDISCTAYPAKILMCLYGIFDEILPRPNKQINDNLEILKDFVAQVSSRDNKDRSSGSGISGISKIMNQVMKAAGIEGEIDGEKIARGIGNALDEKTVGNISRVIGEVTKAVNENSPEGGPKGIEDVLGGLGKALQSNSVKEAVAETKDSVAKATASLQASIPKRGDLVLEVKDDGMEPGEQE